MTDTDLTFPDDPTHFEIRYDPIHGWPVIFAPSRALRPMPLKEAEEGNQPTTIVCSEEDPFIAGNEQLTTPETFAIRDPGTEPNQPGWKIRCISNKYPALSPPMESLLEATGYHEVIIESPEPIELITDLDDQQFQLIFQSYLTRLQQIQSKGKYAHATLFKNQGKAAGASQPHVHSQLMATRFVPPTIQRELEYCNKYQERHSKNHFAELIYQSENEDRIVLQSEYHVVLCPYASRFTCEMHVIPLVESAHFTEASNETVQDLAQVMKTALKRLQAVTQSNQFNYVLHTAPWNESAQPGFRWHWEIYPRLAGIAGWELGQGSFVNPVFPETAARQLREVM